MHSQIVHFESDLVRFYLHSDTGGQYNKMQHNFLATGLIQKVSACLIQNVIRCVTVQYTDLNPWLCLQICFISDYIVAVVIVVLQHIL